MLQTLILQTLEGVFDSKYIPLRLLGGFGRQVRRKGIVLVSIRYY